jgi:cell division protein ZapA
MPLVNVMVNSRAYTIACDEGEEEHLKELAAHVDAKTREVLSSVGQVGDGRVILMAALLIADEHHDAVRKAAPAAPPANGKTQPAEQAEAAERAAADALEGAAKKIEDIAARLVRA